MAINRIKVEETAQRHIRRGHWDRALKEYLLLVEDDPKDARSLLKCADIYVKLERKREALDAYRTVAGNYAQQDMYEKALAVYRQALRLDETQADLHEAIGLAYHMLGRLKDSVRAYYLAQKIYKERGDMARQRTVLEAMIEIDPEDVGLRIQLAERYAKDDLIERALELFRTSADLLEQEGRLDELVQVLERILFLDPADHASRKRVIHLYLNRNEEARALRHLQICFKELPGDIETLELLGQTFERLERISKAVLVYEELVGLYRDQGQERRMEDMYRRILRLDPQNRTARRASGSPATKTSSLASVEHSDKLISTPQTSNLRAASAHLRETKDSLASVEFLDGDDDLFLQPESVSEAAKPRSPEPGGPRPIPGGSSAGIRPSNVAVGGARPPALPVVETFDVVDDLEFLSAASEGFVEFQEFELLDESSVGESTPATGADSAEPWSDSLSEAEVRQLLTECQVFLKYGLYDKANVVISGVLARAPDSIVANEQMLALHEAMNDSAKAEKQLLTLAGISRSNGERSREYLTRALSIARDPKLIYDEARRLHIELDDEPNTEDLGELDASEFDEDESATLGSEITFLEPDSDFESVAFQVEGSAVLSDAELLFDDQADFVDMDIDEFVDLSDAELSALEDVAAEVNEESEAAVIDMVFGELDADDIFDDLFGGFLDGDPAVNPGADDPAGELAEVDFFIQQGLTTQADEALEEFAKSHPGHQGVEARRSQVETIRSGFQVSESAFGRHSLSQKFVNPLHVADSVNDTLAPLSEFGATNNSNLELGVSYRDIGLVQEAIEEFKQAIDDPDAAPVARYHIALCELDLGQREAARATLSSLLADPGITLNSELRSAAQIRLAELEHS